MNNGSIVCWGSNSAGQCSVPSLPGGVSYVSVSGGEFHSAALCSNGTVRAWGENLNNECFVTPLSPGNRYGEVSAGADHCLATRTLSYYRDADGDGFGKDADVQFQFAPVGPGYVTTPGDCDDTRSIVYPGAPDVCDGLDNDCNGTIDPGFITTYCTAGTTVFGCVPSISGQGAPSSSSPSGFDIVVSNVPSQRYGLIFYGSWSISQPQPWGLGSSSYLCIYFPTARTGVQDAGGGALGTCTGELRVDFNQFMANNPAATGAPFHPGQVLHAQGWFRDPGAAKQTNLSDALTFTLCN
jgi:hypothetical protein